MKIKKCSDHQLLKDFAPWTLLIRIYMILHIFCGNEVMVQGMTYVAGSPEHHNSHKYWMLIEFYNIPKWQLE